MFHSNKYGSYCKCEPYSHQFVPSRCTACGACGRGQGCSAAKCKVGCNTPGCPADIEQKRIWKQVRAASSSYMSILGAVTVGGGPSDREVRDTLYQGVGWNQMSDRPAPHQGTAYIPSRGKGTTVRHRPGAGGFAGVGVDVKHGSYARYLARKKAGSVRGQVSPCDAGAPVRPAFGNKSRAVGMLGSTWRCCAALS